MRDEYCDRRGEIPVKKTPLKVREYERWRGKLATSDS